MERTIQTIKQTLRKSREDDSDPYLAILALRTSVNSTNSSAAFALFNRYPRTLIPRIDSTTTYQRQNDSHKHSINLNPLETGEVVRFRDKNSNQWDRMGIVTEKYHTPRSYIIRTDKNSIIRRNRRHLLPSNNKFEITGEEDDTLINNLNNSKDSTTDNNNTDSKITQNEETTNTGSTNSNHEEESNTTNEHRTRSGRLIVKPLRYREKKKLFIYIIYTNLD